MDADIAHKETFTRGRIQSVAKSKVVVDEIYKPVLGTITINLINPIILEQSSKDS